ncbi:MAG: lamin tail domain-containing protein, partial [Phycisphaerae bacterium]|nr:lamin tail domain-containing protein [Phycisphaerae bacterium]
MRKKNWVVILLILAGICLVAKAQCPQFESGLQVGTVANDLLSEISGIAASRKNTDVFWVHNDRGGQARVWALTSEGTHLGIYYLSGATNRDWEDIAIGPGPVDGVDYLYVGNIGGGGAPNPYITVYRVAEPTVDSEQSPVETTLTGVDAINLKYPDGDQYRDAETLMVDPVTKDIYIISKEDVPPRVYRAPYPQSTTTTITMEHVCNLPSPWDESSGGDISLDGSMIIVRDDDDHASIWLRPAGTILWDAFSGTGCSVELPSPSEINGEAICFDAEGRGYYTTTEREGGPNPPIYYFAPVYVNLAITEIMSDSNHAGVDGDWWELTNAGIAAVDLTGYSWHDSPTAGIVIFGNIIISAGESIIILNEPSINTGAWKSVWGLGSEVNVYDQSHFSGSFPGLDSSDNIYLYDSSDILEASVHYPNCTSRISNEWDTDGRFGGLSVVGENGAYESTDPRPNVASPGYAVTTGIKGAIYVDADATGANNGTSWADAFNYLQDALSLASNGDEIRVAEGVYKPDEDTDNPTGTGDREATFQLKNGVTVKGGYAGFGESNPGARDIHAYATVLSGDLDGNDVEVGDPCDLLTEPTRSENSYHVVANSNIDETAVLDGFTIAAGNANGSPDYERDRGGGMFNNGHDSLCNPTVTGCMFVGNSAGEFGGGIFNYGHGDGECNPILTDCALIGNASGQEGGGMFNWEGFPVLADCAFTGNFARSGGGGISSVGFAPTGGSNATLTNCVFTGNSAAGGGGMFNM